MYFDGSKCEWGGGARVVFSPQGILISYLFKLDFQCTNYNAEYEVLILGLKEAIEIKFERLLIYGDSQLVINQILGNYQFHNNILKNYRYLALKLLKLFKAYKIEAAPRSSNQFASTMVSLGSLIPPNPHRCIQHVEIVILKEFVLKSPLPQGLPLASVNEITMEHHDLWYK